MIRQAGYWPEFNQSSEFSYRRSLRECHCQRRARPSRTPRNDSYLSFVEQETSKSSLAERSLHCADDGYVRGRGCSTTNPKPTSIVMIVRCIQICSSDITVVMKTRIHISPGTRRFIMSSAVLGIDSVPFPGFAPQK